MRKIIVMFENEDRELNMSLYDFVNEQYRKANPIMVCHVTEEEYKVMLEQIKHGRLNERSQRIVQEELGYDKFRYLLAFDRVCNNICIANYEDLEQKGNYVVDSDGIHYNENGLQFPKDQYMSRVVGYGIKVYTTETYKDVIRHYKNNECWTQISLSNDEIKRFEEAYKLLSESVKTDDYTEDNLKEFHSLFRKILDKCDK